MTHTDTASPSHCYHHLSVCYPFSGPGCSSIGGFLTELGPFTFTGEKDSTGVPLLQPNPYGWTTVSSVIFLEQPAGVGYSYAVNGSNASDDFIQSQNTYGFLLNFFKAYPEFSKNDFFLTGESYAGKFYLITANINT
jgi:carboxypeptidase C (cathepsin A)